MAKIIIVGASTGGLPMAYELKNKLGKHHEIQVINTQAEFTFVPSNPWVGVGWRTRKDISFPLAPALKKKKIEFIHQAVSALQPEANTLTLTNGDELKYDYLILATGPHLAFEEVEGLGPRHLGGFTSSVCTTDHAEEAFQSWQDFCKAPGPIVVGAVQGASCFGPAYEYAMIMDKDLRNRKIRDQVPMTFVTAEPYIGHLGLGGVGDSKGFMESEMRQRHINWICNAKVVKVEANTIHVDEHNDNGQVIKQHQLPFNYSMLLPAFKGTKMLQGADEKLVNPRGFVKVDEYNRNPSYPNIYALGVGIAIPPVEATPVPCGAPKTGLMIETMVTAIADNIDAELKQKPIEAKATWNTICLADFGDTGIAMVALPQIPPRNVTWARQGKWVHLAKVAFEKYFIRNMKKGNPEPLYQKWILKLIGAKRLKSD
ncbi:NAD(P)/FAD-dependent oxidoreductase [Thiomicrospira pelophila]|uniref:NAD(P)/FAD-dependent oxidoreductase n=1 Tax=Thiomicrospira pelophila TaxID=934 RepID=UPI0004A6EA72|nr:FAD/NAD(P)-binding oxidoreductase [Thiomicrospira pelophila]